MEQEAAATPPSSRRPAVGREGPIPGMPAAPQRILIIKPSSLGDVVSTLPLLCDLKAAFPAARIDWLVHPAFADLVRGHRDVDQAIMFDRRHLAGWWYRPRHARNLSRLIATLRAGRYDCVIDAQGLLRSAILAYVCGSATRIGPADAREGGRLLYTHRVQTRRTTEHSVERMRALARPLGAPGDSPARFDVPVGAEAAAAADKLLEGADRPFVLIPGSRWETKRWPAAKFGRIAQRLAGRGERVVLLGAPDERDTCGLVAAGDDNDTHILNLAGKTTLAEMVAILARARVVIGNDTGPLHVAAALGRPLVGLYGPTNPASVGPYGQLDHVVRFDVACFPCRRKTCDHHSCMANLTEDTVWEAVMAAARQTLSKPKVNESGARA